MKIGIIGIGTIGGIFLEKCLATSFIEKINIYDKENDKIQHYKNNRIKVCKVPCEVVEESENIILAVRPQDSMELFSQISKSDLSSKVIISTMSGVSIQVLRNSLGCSNILRIMPNVACSVGNGVIAADFSESFDENSKPELIQLISKLGKIFIMDERYFPALTSISGSGPAFIFVIIESFIDAGIKMGLSYDLAYSIVMEVFDGSVEMMRQSKKHPAELKNKATSPAGTTIEGIYTLENEGLRGTIMKTLIECYNKAKQFDSSLKGGIKLEE
ncbi:MAG TPA: pyrroline-5-carboxylate reductase [Petrotogaceae bacterium]|jgi:pyrroline-5-carboxylate reductase|nr:pyrroline-5-carboxylate reductase [Petrotogaceae bacterium]HPO27081.1 pyrroline-5-carboxylate reductase [Petrotogaceae bacterium]